MSGVDSLVKNDKESYLTLLESLLNADNESPSFINILNKLKKSVITQQSIHIFNYSVEKYLFSSQAKNEDYQSIFKCLKYYININHANQNYLFSKTEIIKTLLFQLTDSIGSNEEYIFENIKNTKKYKKIIKYLYGMFILLIKMKECIGGDDKHLLNSIRRLKNFFVNLNSFKNEFCEKLSPFFIDFIYLCISQVTLPNFKTSSFSSDDNKLAILVESKKNDLDKKINVQNEYFDSKADESPQISIKALLEENIFVDKRGKIKIDENINNNIFKEDMNHEKFNNSSSLNILQSYGENANENIIKYETNSLNKNNINQHTDKILIDSNIDSNKIYLISKQNQILDCKNLNKNSSETDFQVFKTKLKNFTHIYFEKEVFIKDLQTTKSKNIEEYYSSLKKIIENYFINHHQSLISSNRIDEKNFLDLIKKLFPKCKGSFIGSYSLKYLNNLKENDNSIDISINFEDKNYFKNGGSLDFDKDYVIKILKNFKNKYFAIEAKEEKENLYQLNTLKILVNSLQNDRTCLVDLLFFNDLYLSSNSLLKIFFLPKKSELFGEEEKNFDLYKLIKLHLFFQEILLKKIPILCTNRFELSLLIISYLEYEYEIFNKKENGKQPLNIVCMPDIDLNKLQDEVKFKFRQEDYYCLRLRKKNFKIIFTDEISVSELIDGFFRYILSYLTYFKNIHYDKEGKNNREYCTGFEKLEKRFKKEYQSHLYDSQYVFNQLGIIQPILALDQGKYNRRFVRLIKILENIYFKILENHKEFKNYSEIIFNIEKEIK